MKSVVAFNTDRAITQVGTMARRRTDYDLRHVHSRPTELN